MHSNLVSGMFFDNSGKVIYRREKPQSDLSSDQDALIIDLQDQASLFESQHGEYLLDRRRIVTRNIKVNCVDIEARLNDGRILTDALYSLKGVDYIQQVIMPGHPLFGMQLIYDLVDNRINENAAYHHNHPLKNERQLLVPYLNDVWLDRFASTVDPTILYEQECAVTDLFYIFRPILYIVDSFISTHPWHIYRVELHQKSLHVIRSVDYRIWFYHHHQANNGR